MNNIDWVFDFIDKIPDLLVYVVPGYVYLSVYQFVAIKRKEGNLNHILFRSVVTSYIIKIFYDKVIPDCINEGFLESIVIIGISIFMGYLLGQIVRSKWFNKLLLKIKVHETTNEDIWANIFEDGMWIKVFFEEQNLIYYGQYQYGESNVNDPTIVLAYYQKLDLDENLIEDCCEDPKSKVLIRTKTCNRIEIVYP